jgi:hypothetical protein
VVRVLKTDNHLRRYDQYRLEEIITDHHSLYDPNNGDP